MSDSETIEAGEGEDAAAGDDTSTEVKADEGLSQTLLGKAGEDAGNEKAGDEDGVIVDEKGQPVPGMLSGDDWKAHLATVPEEYRPIASRYPSQLEVYRALDEQYKALSKRVPIPDKYSNADEIAEFRNKIGVPDKFEDYELAIPDDLSEELGNVAVEMTKAMHERGAPGPVVQSALDKMFDLHFESERAHQALLKTQADEAELELRKKFGNDFAAEMAETERLMSRISPPLKKALENMELANGRALGNDPTFIEFMSLIKRSVSEDHLTPPARVSVDAEITDDTVREYYSKHFDAIKNVAHPEHKRRVGEYNEIARINASKKPGGNMLIGRNAPAPR